MATGAESLLLSDLLVEILLRLPVISLLRFRCVCKTWFNLIKSPQFISMHFDHHSRSKTDSVLIKNSPLTEEIYRTWLDLDKNNGFISEQPQFISMHSNDESLRAVSPALKIPYYEYNFTLDVLGPCKGIVCFYLNDKMVLCNPSTREFRLIPDRPFDCPSDLYWDVRVAGFGFDPTTNDYKIVRIVSFMFRDYNPRDFYEVDHDQVEVYTLSTNSWRLAMLVPPLCFYTPCLDASLNGACHWRDFTQILSFHFSSETYQQIEFPDGCRDDGKTKNLVVLNECLALLSYVEWYEYDVDHEPQYIDVWVMKEYGVKKSWTKQFVVGPISILTGLSIWKDDKLFLEDIDGRLVLCTLSTQETKELNIKVVHGSLRVIPYRESLVSIK